MKRPASSCWPSDDILKDPWKPQLGRVGKEEERVRDQSVKTGECVVLCL